MALQLLFGATDVTTLLQAGKVTYSKSINQRWTLQMLLYDSNASHRPADGQPFTLKENGSTIFTGFIDQVQEYADKGTNPASGSSPVYYLCQCSSWASVCDHRMLDTTYTVGRDAFSIIQDIFNNTISADGISFGTVDAIPFITQPLVFQGVTVSQAFEQIRNLINEQWWIDENKALNFQLVGTGTIAGFTVTGGTLGSGNSDWITGTMKVTSTTKDFRNVQWVRCGVGISFTSRTESKTVAQSTDWWFLTQFAMNTTAPTVTVNGVAQPIFQRGVDPNFQNGWYWEPNMFGVQQGQQIAPPIGSVIQVTYDAASDNTTSAQNTASIAARAAIEGTSGKWESVVEAQDIQSFDLAQQLAQGLLSRSSSIPQVITFQTYRNNYVIGQQVQVIVPMHNLNGYYTVQQIQARHIPGFTSAYSSAFEYTITLSNAQDIGGYVKLFETLFWQIKTANQGNSTTGAVNPPPTNNTGSPTQGAWFAEKPIGTYNGSNTAFTLSYTPNPQFVLFLFVNGVFQNPSGSGSADYSLSGNAITFTVAPKSTDQVWCIYFRSAPGSSGGTSGGVQARQYGGPASGSGGSGGYASASGTFNLPDSTSVVGFGTPANGDTVTIGSVTYTFRNSPSSANDVSAVTVSGLVPAQCLANAINGGFGAGTAYGSGTTANPDASAAYSGVGGLTISAKPSPTVNPISLSSSTVQITFTPSSISPGNMTNGDTVTVGSKTYTFVTALNNATPNQILTQAPAAFPNITVQDMLADAINDGPAGSGTWYSSATTQNVDAQAVPDDTNGKIIVTARTPGVGGNSIGVSTSSGGRFTWDGGATTLSGGTGNTTSGGAGTDKVDWGTNDTLYRITGDLTIAMWIKLPSNASGSLLQYGGTSGSISPTNADPYGMTVQGSSGAWNILYVHDSVSPNSNQSHTFATAIPNDTWVFIAIVRDITGSQVTMYKAFVGDTSLTTVGTFTFTHPPGGTSSGGKGLYIGNRHDSSTSFGLGPLTGTIEEYYIWSRQLTTDELLAAMQGNPPASSMALGCKTGDSPEVDISGNGGSGTVTGTALVQGHG